MLCKFKTLKGYKLNSLDGEIGKIIEFYFDGKHWTIRYLVAETGNWLIDRQVLISPYALGLVMSQEQSINVNLTKEQIESSPSLDTDKPVSQQFEESFYDYYGWPMYWGGAYSWGGSYSPKIMLEAGRRQGSAQGSRQKGLEEAPIVVPTEETLRDSSQDESTYDIHLRSTLEVIGYNIHAKDGEIGHVEDFIIDDETWAIRYLVVATRSWWPGKKVIISPEWIENVSWGESKVFINLSRKIIKQSPEYIETSLLTRAYETGLHYLYNLPGYWHDDSAVNSNKISKSDMGKVTNLQVARLNTKE